MEQRLFAGLVLAYFFAKGVYVALNYSALKANGAGKWFLLVPEQFSFETERAVLHLLGEQGMDRISVFSFSRLCEHVEIECRL